MVRKRKKKDEQKIFCYYCDREFADEATLIQHQKAKHFRCEACHKKLSSSSGLVVHCFQVHKIAVERVPNAIAGRDNPDLSIFGMSGVPEDVLAGGGAAGQGEAPEDGAAKQPRTDATQGSAGYMAAYPYGQPAGPYPAYPGAAAPYMAPTHTAPPVGAYHQPPHMSGYGAPLNLPPQGHMGGPPPPAYNYPPGYANQPHRPPYGGMPAAPYPGPAQGPPALFPAARPAPSLFPAAAGAGPASTAGAPVATFPAGGTQPPSSTFPAAAAAGNVNPAASIIPGLGSPTPAQGAGQPAATPENGAAASSQPRPVLLGEALLLWADEATSMEERRASLPRYASPAAAKAPGRGPLTSATGAAYNAVPVQPPGGALYPYRPM